MSDKGTLLITPINENGEELKITEQEAERAFACCLKNLRQFKRYTLKEVSEGTGVPIPTVLRYENGENVPSVVQAYKFSYFYKIGLNDMFLAGCLDNEGQISFFERYFK